MYGVKMNKIIFVIAIFLLFGCQDEASKNKIEYELQEKCSKSAEHWVTQYKDILNYKSHYNSHLNKCFVHALVSTIETHSFSLTYEMIYDVNENKEYGHNSIQTYFNGSPEICMTTIKGKHIDKSQSKDQWDAFVKEIMER
jgi:hypothetical protein